MRALLLFLTLSMAAFAQDAKPCGTEAECSAAFKKHIAEQEAEAKAQAEKKSADEKAKADALAKLDNKNPQPIKKDEDRHHMELLNARRLLDQQKLETLQAIVKPTIEKMVRDAQASEKTYHDALAEQQKKHHAEGCAVVYDERGDVKISDDGKQVWDCSKIK